MDDNQTTYRVLLLNPPAAGGVKLVREGRCMQRKGAWTAVWTPISLAYIGSVLESEGFHCRLHDCIVEELDYGAVSSIIKEYRPHVVVINTATPSITSDLHAAEVAKGVDPETVTLAIGIHVTIMKEESLKGQPNLDAIAMGEPEHTIRDAALALRAGRSWREVPGLAWLERDKVVETEPRGPIEDLDSLGFPAYALIQRDRYIMPFTDRQFLLVATARGCPYHCNFCADPIYYGHKLRLRDPRHVADELAWAGSEYGIRDFLFWSESFTLNRNFAVGVADEIIRRGLKVMWVCNSRVDHVDAEMLAKFKEAGCWMVGYGVESGNNETLKAMNKRVTIENTVEAVNLTKEAGIDVTAHCVIGYPGETPEMIENTVNFVTGLNIDFAQFYCAVPFPGSKLYEEAKNNGWLTTDDWTYYEQNYSVLTTPQLSADEAMRLRSRAYRKFYFRPSMFIKHAKRIRNPAVFKQALKMLLDFKTWI